MALEADLRYWIFADYKLCEANIRRILYERKGNRKVTDSSEYLRPTTIPKLVRFDDPNGTVAYYTKIRNCLESALKEGFFPEEFESFNPPEIYRVIIR